MMWWERERETDLSEMACKRSWSQRWGCFGQAEHCWDGRMEVWVGTFRHSVMRLRSLAFVCAGVRTRTYCVHLFTFTPTSPCLNPFVPAHICLCLLCVYARSHPFALACARSRSLAPIVVYIHIISIWVVDYLAYLCVCTCTCVQ